MAEEQMGIDLLLQLPNVHADERAQQALIALDQAMARGDTCIQIDEQSRTSLLASGLVGDANARLPIVLEDELLSSRRYWRYEATLAEYFLKRCRNTERLALYQTDEALANDIAKLFPRKKDARVEGVDWQRVAACVALVHGLSIISGGPGTGKTTVAGRVIALLERNQQRQQQRGLSVYIAAPTGKAAQRLRESLMATTQKLVAQKFLKQEQVEALTANVATLHRLLYDRHVAFADLVVIDEVSMADVATLTRVLERLSDQTQIILLGDPKQLASVDAGHVLGELARFQDAHVWPGISEWYTQCGGGKEPLPYMHELSALSAAQVHLRKNWRSADSPAVSQLADAVQESSFQVLCTLANPHLSPQAQVSVELEERQLPIFIERCDLPNPARLLRSLNDFWLDWAKAVCGAASPEEALAIHGQRRILCARREGTAAVEWVNAGIERALEEAGLIHPWENDHYHGRPLLVTRNNYDLQIFNGDIGIVQGTRQEAFAYFPDNSGSLRKIPVHRLDAVEPVFAMSIHKSQGSQFEHVDVITSAHDEGGLEHLLTRELIYTAVTRAAYSVRLWSDEDLLVRSLDRRTVRRTGLGRFLQA